MNAARSLGDGKRVLSPCSPDESEPSTHRMRPEDYEQNAPSMAGINMRQMVQDAMAGSAPVMAPGAISSIIQNVLSALQPIIATTIEACVQRAVEEASARMWDETTYLRDELLEMAWRVDDNEQYSRRDNIKIAGLDGKQTNNGDSATENNDTNHLVIQTCKKMGVDITENDISTSHWLPGKTKQVIVKFTRRETKKRVMEKKNQLKKGDPTIHDDLTVPRLRLLREVRGTHGLKYAFTRDGYIHCVIHESDGQDRKVKIRRPGDLHKIGWNDDDIRSTYELFE